MSEAHTYGKGQPITQISVSSASVNLGSITYAYDASGRVTNQGGTLVTLNLPSSAAYQYNAAGRLVSLTVTLSYDANGSLTTDGTNQYQ